MVPSKNNQHAGFTLIEVLIALAILSISLTAIIKSTSQSIKDTIYLQDKSIAHWVGLQIMNDARSGALKLSAQSDKLTDESEMLGTHWTWEARLKSTANPHISEIDVDVYRQSDHAKLAALVSYSYAAATS
jgi:general secretion pathway protein I